MNWQKLEKNIKKLHIWLLKHDNIPDIIVQQKNIN